jgi:hypothetical protein
MRDLSLLPGCCNGTLLTIKEQDNGYNPFDIIRMAICDINARFSFLLLRLTFMGFGG